MSALGAIRCDNGTRRGGICKRWVTFGGECPNHGLPFLVRYPDMTSLVERAVLRYWSTS